MMTKNKVSVTDEKTLYSSCQDKSSVSGEKRAEMSKSTDLSSKSTKCESICSPLNRVLNETGLPKVGKANERARGFATRPDVPSWLYINVYRTMDAHGQVLSLTKSSTPSVPSHGFENLEEEIIAETEPATTDFKDVEQLVEYYEVYEQKQTYESNYESNITKPREV